MKKKLILTICACMFASVLIIFTACNRQTNDEPVIQDEQVDDSELNANEPAELPEITELDEADQDEAASTPQLDGLSILIEHALEQAGLENLAEQFASEGLDLENLDPNTLPEGFDPAVVEEFLLENPNILELLESHFQQ